MLSRLQDECPLVVVLVNSRSLQTNCAFVDQRWMQRVQPWDDLWEKIHAFPFLFYPSFASFLLFKLVWEHLSRPECSSSAVVQNPR